MSASIAITVFRDKTCPFDIAVKKKDGTAQPLAGTVLWFHAAVNGVDITKNSPDNGITIIDDAAGLAQLQIDPSDTASIPQSGTFAGPCELTLQAGSAAYELNTGSMRVVPNVGTP